MIERFLRYSFENGKRIRLMLLGEDGAAHTLNVTVTALGADVFSARSGSKGKTKEYKAADVLSAGYARGDDGALSG